MNDRNLSDTKESTMSPNEAFNALGNEVRIRILQILGESDEPIGFTELRNRVGHDDPGNFNYHLGKLEGHFVRETEDGYVIRKAGRRVIEAVLSGAVTEDVVMEPTRLDIPCPFCNADIEVRYLEERLLIRCTECVGSFGDIEPTTPAIQSLPHGTLTLSHLPSAGIKDRTPRELLDTAQAWTYYQFVIVANDICPRCSGPVEHSVDICSNHETDKPICDQCQTRFAIMQVDRCVNCGHERRGGFSHHLLGNPRVRTFFETRGVDPIAPNYENLSPIYDYEEEVLSTDPFEARFTFTVDGDDLVVTVNNDLNIVDITVTEE
ncbi:MAG: winged helix-turn-helix domain-containing protein [Halobacteria archaeon]|nr:winged helix-turn-helix domain-containing protein [Halobacteria archaeon]